MKSKTFTGGDPAAVIKAVNDWLAGETGITIRDTRSVFTEPGGTIEFHIQYDQDPAE